MKTSLCVSAVVAVVMCAGGNSVWADTAIGGPRSTGVAVRTATSSGGSESVGGVKLALNGYTQAHDGTQAISQGKAATKPLRIGGPRSTH